MADFVYVDPEYQAYLRREGLLKLETLLNWSDGECVGRHGPREIRRISLPGRDEDEEFYLRKDHRISLGEIAGQVLRFRQPVSRAVRTMQAAQLLGRVGVDTMRCLCLIERQCLSCPRKAAGIFTAVPGRDLYAQLLIYGRPDRRTTNGRARQKLLYDLGEFVAQFQRTRLSWPDFVAKHVYVAYTGETNPRKPWWRFALIDIENLGATCSAAERHHQFGHLLWTMRGLLTATDVLRIMTGYTGMHWVRSSKVRRELLRKFFPGGFRWIRRARRERALLRTFPQGRPLPEEEIYERIDNVTVNLRFSGLLAKLGLSRLDKILTFVGSAELHKPGLGGRHRYPVELRDDEGRPVWLYVKRTRRPRLTEQLARMCSGTIRHSSSWHERTIIKRLGALRIPVPVVVAYGERMLLGYERRSALITEGIVGQSLERFVPKHFARLAYGQELRRRRVWIRQLAAMIRRFHRAGYCHRDLYLSHVFIGFDGDGGPIFYLIDLARCFKMRVRKQRWIVKDLAGLHFSTGPMISRTDRLRFLLTYLGISRLDADAARLIRRVVAKSGRIARHQRRRGRFTIRRPHESSVDDRTT